MSMPQGDREVNAQIHPLEVPSQVVTFEGERLLASPVDEQLTFWAGWQRVPTPEVRGLGGMWIRREVGDSLGHIVSRLLYPEDGQLLVPYLRGDTAELGFFPMNVVTYGVDGSQVGEVEDELSIVMPGLDHPIVVYRRARREVHYVGHGERGGNAGGRG